MTHSPYRMLAIMAALSFVSMYVLMYAMVNTMADVFMSYNQVYMAGLMTAPMIVIELLLMRGMYKDARRNVLLIAVSVILGVALFAGIRQQTAIGDRQFLRSMIPHHSGAVLMCSEAPVSDPEIRDLCRSIIAGQEEEIAQMKRILQRLE